MKGMLDLLERAGIVRRVGEGDAAAHDPLPSPESAAEQPAATESTPPAAAGLSLEQIYIQAGVPPCAYPAERLLRLIDGLKAMDEPTRRTTIQAIDSADDSWSIADPMRDAAAKVGAIERHAGAIRAGVAQAEQQTQSELQQLQQRQASTVAEIRRQIADLEGLLAREVERGAQGAAALETALSTQRMNANQELDTLSRAASALTALITQFGTPTPTK